MQDPHHGKKPGMHAICIPSPSFLDFHFVAVFYVLVGAKKSVCELLNVVTVTLLFWRIPHLYWNLWGCKTSLLKSCSMCGPAFSLL